MSMRRKELSALADASATGGRVKPGHDGYDSIRSEPALITRGDVRADLRINEFFPFAARKDAVMADIGLQMVAFR